MSDKLTKIVVVLTVVGLMSVGPAAYAMSEEDNPENGKDYKRGGPGQARMQGPMDGLNLTLLQREALMALSDPAKQERGKDMAVRMKTKMQALDVAVAESGITLTDVSDLIEEIGTLYTQLLSKKMDHLFAMKKILTPEQFAKMMEMNKQEMPGMNKQKMPGMNKQQMNQKPGGSEEKNQESDQQ